MLADEHDPVVLVEGDDAGREVREVDDAVDAGLPSGRVTSSCQTVIHAFSYATRRLRRTKRPDIEAIVARRGRRRRRLPKRP